MVRVTSVARFQTDSLITAAARGFATGDPLGALETRSPCAPTRLRSRFEASRWRSSSLVVLGAGQRLLAAVKC